VRAARRVGAGLAVSPRIACGAGSLDRRHLELIKPMNQGDAAPAIALDRGSAPGCARERVTCRVARQDHGDRLLGDLVQAVPGGDAAARSADAGHPDIAVIRGHLDDAPRRTRCSSSPYAMTLPRRRHGDASEPTACRRSAQRRDRSPRRGARGRPRLGADLAR